MVEPGGPRTVALAWVPCRFPSKCFLDARKTMTSQIVPFVVVNPSALLVVWMGADCMLIFSFVFHHLHTFPMDYCWFSLICCLFFHPFHVFPIGSVLGWLRILPAPLPRWHRPNSLPKVPVWIPLVAFSGSAWGGAQDDPKKTQNANNTHLMRKPIRITTKVYCELGCFFFFSFFTICTLFQ